LPRENMPPTTIPEGKLFVLGDNRLNSNDSRAFGMVTLEEVVGRAWLRYWPLNEVSLF
jgi:signal peptidase I